MIKVIKHHWGIIIYLFLYFIITSYKFIHYATPFYDWDEGIYAQVGREMINKLSLTPLWQGQVWLDKPPLVPLFYGLIGRLPFASELSMRFATLGLSLLVLGLIYVFYYRITKNKSIAFLTVIFTSFIPLFVQRSQVLNVDVFLLLGWMGYIVFFPHFWWSLFFLAVGVLSKSLLGFYPAMMLLGYQVWKKLIAKDKKTANNIKSILTQIIIILSWYLIMLFIYKQDFIRAHFLESHLKRVTSSIESHFGQRTFYFDELFNQLGLIKWLLPLGIIFIFIDFFKKKKNIFYLLFFVPWFLFLNLTKTKITWYLYVIIPQFAFISAYSINLFRKYRIINTVIVLILTGLIINNAIVSSEFFTTHYSQPDKHYQLAIYAKNQCNRLGFLIPNNTRNTYSTLKNMNLVIQTTRWWGDHPSIVYYFGKKVDFIYDLNELKDYLNNIPTDNCIAFYNNDVKLISTINKLNLLQSFDNIQLYKK